MRGGLGAERGEDVDEDDGERCCWWWCAGGGRRCVELGVGRMDRSFGGGFMFMIVICGVNISFVIDFVFSSFIVFFESAG